MWNPGLRAGLLFICALSLSSAGPLGYSQVNLVSDGAAPAVTTDPNLVNPWGMSFSATSPIWVANQGTSTSTLYNGAGVPNALVVSVPGSPTGTVFNGTANFNGDRFIFATLSGTIQGWQGSLGTTAATRASAGPGNVYTGLASGGDHLFAANFSMGKVDVFDSSYAMVNPAGAFVDPSLPSGYAPFGIQTLGSDVYVMYAKQGVGEEEPGPGFGFVTKFNTKGEFQQRVITGDPGNPSSPLNAPWGVALAPSNFGDLSGMLLVGNFGDGKINAFNPTTGAFVTSLNDAMGNPIVNEGLWGIAFGNGAQGTKTNSLYFNAGIEDEEHGLFGALSANTVPEPGTLLSLGAGLLILTARARRLF